MSLIRATTWHLHQVLHILDKYVSFPDGQLCLGVILSTILARATPRDPISVV